MTAKVRSWQIVYLRWAGFFSAVIGLLATISLLSSIWQSEPLPKLIQALLGIIGILLSYDVGKDLLDRARNHEESAAWISNTQLRLAIIGTKFGFVLPFLVVGLILASVAFWMIIANAPWEICGFLFRSDGDCARYLGIPYYK